MNPVRVDASEVADIGAVAFMKRRWVKRNPSDNDGEGEEDKPEETPEVSNNNLEEELEPSAQ